MTDLDPVALLSEVIGLRSVLGDSIARERAMAATLTDCQRQCTAYETELRSAHDALDEATSAPRTLPLDGRVRVALVDVLAELAALAETATQGRWAASFTVHEPLVTHHVCTPEDVMSIEPAELGSDDDAHAARLAAFIAAANPATVLALVAEVRRLTAVVEGFAEHDCAYGDGCPPFGTRHGCCVGCQARRALTPDGSAR